MSFRFEKLLRLGFTNICICFYLSILCQFSLAADTYALNQSISDGQTLLSPGHIFELGFFSPGKSKNRYLGIWYNTTPDIIVWVANRNTPITDSGGIFTISGNGTLLLLDSTKNSIWLSNISRVAVSPVLQLLDTGNLVLIDKTSKNLSDYLWKSFDYPGDTRLPGMVMGENTETGKNTFLTSWKNVDDPSTGSFIFKFENHGLPMMVILMNGTRKSYRTGPWNGIQFNGLTQFIQPVEETIHVFDKEQLVSVYDRYNSSVLTRLTLNESGFIQRYVLDGTKNKWNLIFSVPSNICNEYEKCGRNGLCNSNISPSCTCLKGFTPKNRQEWELFDWTSGCVRIETPNCENGDGFLNISRVKLPDMLQFELKRNISLSQCEDECFKNCSCKAYTNPYVIEGKNDCLMWYGDLLDVREYDNARSNQNVFVRVPISELELSSGSVMKMKKRPVKVILISIASGILFLGLVYGCIILNMNRKREDVQRKAEELELPLFDLATIAAATRSFSQENMVGEGGFGPVYKGCLSTGQEVAVKRLSKDSGQGAEEFKNEVILIAKLQHRNLVRLLGCCIQGDERMLIYEYMQNKSLDLFISGSNPQILTWTKRFDIIMGIARGLLYLHQDSRLKIIHRDLKTSNILLDDNLEPKISDFGLARIFDGNQMFLKTKRVMGTYGYMAPEYAIDGKFSDKSDIFSMGVLILEIVSGKKNRYFSHPDHHHTLLGHTWLLWNENRALELIDECLKESFVDSQVMRCIQVGLLCVQNFSEDRPRMSYVVSMLGNEGAILPQPKQPGFFLERSSGNVETIPSERQGGKTGNMITITQLEPR